MGAFISGQGAFSFVGDWTPLIVVLVSALAMALFTYLADKKGIAWLDNFSIAGSMLRGVVAAGLLGRCKKE